MQRKEEKHTNLRTNCGGHYTKIGTDSTTISSTYMQAPSAVQEGLTWIIPRIFFLCVCGTGHQSVRYVLIMRGLCSNLRQWPLRKLGSVAIFTTLNLALPPHLFQPFLYCSSSSLHPTAPQSVYVNRCSPLFGLHLIPTSSTRAKRHPPGRHPHLSASAAYICPLPRMPASTAISLDCDPPPLTS